MLMGTSAKLQVQGSNPNHPGEPVVGVGSWVCCDGLHAGHGSGGDGAGAGSREPRPQKEKGIKCRYCNSTDTKFRYYYKDNIGQPRYSCRTCRRYWTESGSPRNVSLGGGSGKKRRSTSSLSSASASASHYLENPSMATNKNPKPAHEATLPHTVS
jgi:hypothetical protein